MATMTDAQREKLTKIAVVDCISESPEIEAYFQRHPEIDPKEGVDLGEVLHDIEFHDDACWKIDDPYFQILKSYQESNSEEFNKLVIRDYTATEDLGRYVTVQTDTVDGEPYYQVSFNGTMSAEGIDNAEGLYQESTVQQQVSLDYFKDMANKFGFTKNHVALSGHSKGGNEVTYTCMTASGQFQDMIDLAVSLDGQGHSNEAMAQWQESPSYQEKTNKIYGIYGEYDYVHPLGHSVVPENNRFYLRYNENSLREQDDKFESLHMLSYMFSTDGNQHFIAQLEANGYPSDQVKYEKAFSDELMKLGPDQLKDGAKFLMSMIWSKPSPDGEKGGFNVSALKSLLKAIGGVEDHNRVRNLRLFLITLDMVTNGFVSDAISAYLTDWIPLGLGDTIHSMFSDTIKWAFTDSIPLGLGDSMFSATEKCSVISLFLWFLAGGSTLFEGISHPFSSFEEAAQKDKEERLHAAGAEAAAYPEFWLDPAIMLQTAGDYAYLGGEFQNAASALKQSAGKIAVFGFFEYNPYFDSDIYNRISQLEKKAQAETQKYNSIRSKIFQAANDLSDCVATINGVLAYLRDTGSNFQQVEVDLKDQVENWEQSSLPHRNT